MRCKVFLIALALAFFGSGEVHAETLEGKLVRVLDGDTIEVMLDDRNVEDVRLAHIYAPLKDQPFGIAAKTYIWRVAGNKGVAVRFEEYDPYGRPMGEVFLADGTNLNKLVIGAGYAWQHKEYSDDSAYADLEAGARKARMGLWEMDNPVPPWEWRWIQAMATMAKKSGSTDYTCGTKQTCSEMTSCDEAKFYLYGCGLDRLDRDGNGIPCDAKCK